MAASKPTKLLTPQSLAVDLVLCAVFFTIMYLLVSPHVQSYNPLLVRFWGAATAACMTAVFWLASQMFRVVLRAQRARVLADSQRE